MHDYISGASSLDDGILAFMLPSLLTPLQSSRKDVDVAVSLRRELFPFYLTQSSTSSEALFFYALSPEEST